MNNLNSVLIEGRIVSGARHAGQTEGGDPVCVITLEARRPEGNCRIEVETRGKAAEAMLENGKEGALARACGRLKGENPRIALIAEHVEYKQRKEAENGGRGIDDPR